jgi:hypothetical protein
MKHDTTENMLSTEPTRDQDAAVGRLLRRLVFGFVAIGVLHAISTRNGFMMDDYAFLDTVRNLSWSDLPRVFTSGNLDETGTGVWWTPSGMLPFYRPLAILSFAADHAVWGISSIGFHLTNLLLHLGCVLMVWRLVLHFSGDRATALAAALIFGIHPVHTEAVVWISGRFDMLVCACSLGSVLCFLRWRVRENASVCWCVASLCLYIAGLGAKETALVTPVFIVFAEFIRRREENARPRTGSMLIAAGSFALIGSAYLVGRVVLFGGLGSLPPPYGVDLTTIGGFIDLARNVGQYFIDFVLFVQADAVYMVDYWNAHAWQLISLIIVAGAVVTVVFRLAGASRSIFVGLVWTAIFTAPTLPAMPGERNVYLASVGVAMIAGSALMAIARRSAIRPAALRRLVSAVVCLCIILCGFEHWLTYRITLSSDRLYDDLVAIVPDPPPNARIYVVNQNPFVATGFTAATRILYDRDDIIACALTLAPDATADTNDVLYRTGPYTVRIVRQGGVFISGFFERLLLFGNTPANLPAAARRVDLELLSPPETLDDWTEMDFRMPRRLDDPSMIILKWDNHRVKTLTDAILLAEWPKLVRCPILDLPAGQTEHD